MIQYPLRLPFFRSQAPSSISCVPSPFGRAPRPPASMFHLQAGWRPRPRPPLSERLPPSARIVHRIAQCASRISPCRVGERPDRSGLTFQREPSERRAGDVTEFHPRPSRSGDALHASKQLDGGGYSKTHTHTRHGDIREHAHGPVAGWPSTRDAFSQEGIMQATAPRS